MVQSKAATSAALYGPNSGPSGKHELAISLISPSPVGGRPADADAKTGSWEQGGSFSSSTTYELPAGEHREGHLYHHGNPISHQVDRRMTVAEGEKSTLCRSSRSALLQSQDKEADWNIAHTYALAGPRRRDATIQWDQKIARHTSGHLPPRQSRQLCRRRGSPLPKTFLSSIALLLVLVLLTSTSVLGQRQPQAIARSYPHLASSSLSQILTLSDPAPFIDHRSKTSLLSRILIPRVPGSKGIIKVRQTIMEVFEKDLAPSKEHGRSGWHVERHRTSEKTPVGHLPFTNLVFTKNPHASRRLVLAAHYDSKYFKSGDFVGATDSAAPCAMLVDVAVALDALLEGKRDEDLTLQLIFFDGEEAFKVWTRTDSTYGSRALASNWSQTYFAPQTPSELSRRKIMSSPLSPVRKIDSIEHLVLLDLLGAKEPNIPSYFASTDWLFKELVNAEKRLADNGILLPRSLPLSEADVQGNEQTRSQTYRSFFASGPVMTAGGIEDDHLPFLANGVPIVHLIPRPFPKVWHTLKDDASALDYPTMHAWVMLLRLFVAEYLELDLAYVRKGERGALSDEDEGWGDDSWLRDELVSLGCIELADDK